MYHSLYCGKWRKGSRVRVDLDLDCTTQNIEIDTIFITYIIFKYNVPSTIIILVITQKHTHKHTHRLL